MKSNMLRGKNSIFNFKGFFFAKFRVGRGFSKLRGMERAQHKPVKHIIYNLYDLQNEGSQDRGPFPRLDLPLSTPIVG